MLVLTKQYDFFCDLKKKFYRATKYVETQNCVIYIYYKVVKNKSVTFDNFEFTFLNISVDGWCTSF